MKATFIRLESAIEKSIHIVTLLSLLFWVHPGMVNASSIQSQEVNSSLVFNIEPKAKAVQQEQILLSMDEVVKNDPLTIKVQKYLEDHNSPLAPNAAFLVQLQNWKKDLAIATVESNMCIHDVNFNCSGITMRNGKLEPFDSYTAWATRMDGLMSSPTYADRSFKQMINVYVVPGSIRWRTGAEKTYAELTDIENQATQDRIALANKATLSAVTNNVQLAELK